MYRARSARARTHTRLFGGTIVALLALVGVALGPKAVVVVQVDSQPLAIPFTAIGDSTISEPIFNLNRIPVVWERFGSDWIEGVSQQGTPLGFWYRPNDLAALAHTAVAALLPSGSSLVTGSLQNEILKTEFSSDRRNVAMTMLATGQTIPQLPVAQWQATHERLLRDLNSRISATAGVRAVLTHTVPPRWPFVPLVARQLVIALDIRASER